MPPACSRGKRCTIAANVQGRHCTDAHTKSSGHPVGGGAGQVIKAWDIGVASMKKGEKAKLTCRADYAYGDSGSPPKIPGGATLNFEVRNGAILTHD